MNATITDQIMVGDVGNKILVDAIIITAMLVADQTTEPAEITEDLITETPMAILLKIATIAAITAMPIMAADQIQGADSLKNAIKF